MSKLARLFEGWQAGLVVIVTAVLVGIVVVPRPTVADEIPLPKPDWRELRKSTEVERQRAAAAEQEGLPFEVRSVGEAVRQIGLAAARSDHPTALRLETSLEERLHGAAHHGPEALLRLRAYQTAAFLSALRTFETTGAVSPDLEELGGDFVQVVTRAGWLQDWRGKPRFVADDHVRRILFRKRWNDITKLSHPAFAISLEEQRALHAFLLSHPVVDIPESHRHDTRMRCRVANEYLLRKVTQLAEIDRAYPADYARGILLLRLGQAQSALIPLVRYLEQNPDGPHTLRARNALRLAQAEMHSLYSE